MRAAAAATAVPPAADEEEEEGCIDKRARRRRREGFILVCLVFFFGGGADTERERAALALGRRPQRGWRRRLLFPEKNTHNPPKIGSDHFLLPSPRIGGRLAHAYGAPPPAPSLFFTGTGAKKKKASPADRRRLRRVCRNKAKKNDREAMRKQRLQTVWTNRSGKGPARGAVRVSKRNEEEVLCGEGFVAQNKNDGIFTCVKCE